MHTSTPDTQMRQEFTDLIDDFAPAVHEYRGINMNASDFEPFLELLRTTAQQVRDMQHAVITRNIDRHLAGESDPLAPPVGDMLLFDYGRVELHFRRSDGHYVITWGDDDYDVYQMLDEACNSFADRAGCSPEVVLDQAVRLTEGA